jgi:hypothetical protein
MCIAFISGAFGAFGMNLPSGIEETSYAFYVVGTGSLLVTAIVYYRLLRYMRGDFSRSVESRQYSERKLLESIFLDIDTVNILVNTAINRVNDDNGNGLMTKDEFSKLFLEIKGTDKVDPEEIDTLFNLLDANVDGVLYKKELDHGMTNCKINAEERKET